MEEIVLQNGATIQYDDDKHRYYFGDLVVPSVTQILDIINKPALKYWAVNLAVAEVYDKIQPHKEYSPDELEEVLENARREHDKMKHMYVGIGKQVHAWLEHYIETGKKKRIKNPDIKTQIKTFLKWEEEHDIEFLETERLVFHDELNYCGRLDFIAMFEGKKVLGDFKTSNRLYPEHSLQTVAYQKALERDGVKVDGRLILRLDRNGNDIQTFYTDEIEKDFAGFCGALALYNRLK